MAGVRRRTKSLWPWLALLLVSGGVVGSIAWEVWPRTLNLSLLRQRSREVSAPAVPGEDRIRARLFFPQETKAILTEEEREIARPAGLTDGVRRLIRELAKGGDTGTIPPLSAGVEVRHLYLDTFGILYLDCSAEIHSLAERDSTEGGLALSAVLLTLSTNFTEVKRVQFLAEGHEISGRVGSADLGRPVQPHFLSEESQPIIHELPEGN